VLIDAFVAESSSVKPLSYVFQVLKVHFRRSTRHAFAERAQADMLRVSRIFRRRSAFGENPLPRNSFQQDFRFGLGRPLLGKILPAD